MFPKIKSKRKSTKRKAKEEFWSHPNVDAARNSPCVCCNRMPPSDPHHLETRGSGGGNEKHNVFGFCREHHTEIHKIGITKMAESYLDFKNKLLDNNWQYIEFLGKWKHL